MAPPHPDRSWAAAKGSDSAAHSNETKSTISDMMEVLLPDRVAIVAEVEEEWAPVLDTRMEAIGGVVFRWTISEAQHALHA